MTSTVSDFITSLSGPVRGFPSSLGQVYAELMGQFKTDPVTKGFDQISTNKGFEDPTLRGVAHRMHWWFPTHFFKFQDALLQCEQRCRKSGQALLLDRPKVVFVDLGCGAGAASAAVLATLEQYQLFCGSRSIRVDPIRVNLIALDPVHPELDLYERLIGTYTPRIEKLRIHVDIRTICQRFPEGTPQLVEALISLQGHVIIVGMSNLINWIWNEWDVHWKAGDLDAIENLNPAEVAALRQLTEQTDFDIFHVIGVATKSRSRQLLPTKLSEFIKRLAADLGLAARPFGERWSVHTTVLFENPEGSHWVRDRPQAPSNYYVENLVNVAPSYARDSRLATALSMNSLEAAWAKVRSYMWYEALTDQVELKLFENDLDTNLRKLRAACLERDYQCMNVDCDLSYSFPKDEQSTRPKALTRFEEQVIAAAVGVNLAEELAGPHPEVSYSHRLAPADSEFLYEYWFVLYRKYLSEVLKQLDKNSVCITDIKSYYVHIRQATLLKTLQERLRVSPRCHELLAATIVRDCHKPHLAGYGLIQGHAMSGLLANVMLQPVDSRLVNHRGMQGRYFRFTDDITVTGAVDPDRDTITPIQEELSALDPELRLNSEKSYKYSPQKYRRKVSGSKDLDTVGKRFRALLLPVFITNRSYRREFGRTGWHFVYRYQQLLGGIGLHFSPEWLHRKLDEYGRLWRQVRAFRRRWNLSWPPLSLAASESGRLQWLSLFENRNPDWADEKLALKRKLASLLIDSARDLIAGSLSEDVLGRRARVLKFALYRLSIFGVEDAVPEITQLVISQPWNIPPRLTCQALARINEEAALGEVLAQTNFSYVRAMALRALGEIRTDNSVFLLASALDGGGEPIEKLMASEGLLDANLWQRVELDRIKIWLEQEAGEPYVQKNVVLILGQAYPEEAQDLLQAMDHSSLHPIVRIAIHYVLTKPPTENLLWKPEPEILRKYRAKSYPTIEELLGDEGSYEVVSR